VKKVRFTWEVYICNAIFMLHAVAWRVHDGGYDVVVKEWVNRELLIVALTID